VSEENDEHAAFAGGSGVSRRAVVWTVVALAGAFVLAVVGVIVFSVANAEELVTAARADIVGPRALTA
jgi:hypothetical protein